MGIGKTEAITVQVNGISKFEKKGMIQTIENVCEPATDFGHSCRTGSMRLNYVTLCLELMWHFLRGIERGLTSVSSRCGLCVPGCIPYGGGV